MKRALRRIGALVSPAASASGIRVLLYHAVEEPDPRDRMSMRVPRERFREQLECLRADGYHVVPLASVLAPRDDHAPRVAITFDDGYRSTAWASRILREYGFPATFFVVPRFLEGVRTPEEYWEHWGHLGWDDLAALADEGFDIGAHSATHEDLRRCSADRLRDEVCGAKAILEKRLGREVPNFSYPFGRHDERVREAVERAGYRLGCTSRYGENDASSPPYAIRRTEVAGTDTLEDFRWKLQGKYDWLGHWQDLKSNA